MFFGKRDDAPVTVDLMAVQQLSGDLAKARKTLHELGLVLPALVKWQTFGVFSPGPTLLDRAKGLRTQYEDVVVKNVELLGKIADLERQLKYHGELLAAASIRALAAEHEVARLTQEAQSRGKHRRR